MTERDAFEEWFYEAYYGKKLKIMMTFEDVDADDEDDEEDDGKI